MLHKVNFESISNQELGYLVGLYLGDGYIAPNDNYRLEFYLNSINDKCIQDYLLSICNKLHVNLFIIRDKRYNYNKLRVNSKELINVIKLLEHDFSDFKLVNKELLMGSVSGFIDAEGYVNHGEIVVTQKDKDVLEKFIKYSELLNIKITRFWSSDNPKSKNKIWRLRISTQFKNMHHNSQKVFRRYPKIIIRESN